MFKDEAKNLSLVKGAAKCSTLVISHLGSKKTPNNRIECFKNVNNCLNTNIYSYLETTGGQSFNIYLNVVHFFNTSVN